MGFRGERYGLQRYRSFALGTILGGVGMLVASPSGAANWQVTPSLELQETYTDNVNLATGSENRQSDFVTRITPGVNVVGAGARASLNLTYTPSLLIFARSDEEDTDLRHFLRASGRTELSRDFFFVDFGASINQQFLERGGAISSNESNVTDNRRTVQNYTISPYLRERFGTFATGELRYRASYTNSSLPEDRSEFGPDILSKNLSHIGTLSINSGTRFNRFTWSSVSTYRRIDRRSGREDADRYTTRLFGNYQLNRMVRFVGSVGYEKINDNTLSRRPDGFIWDAGVTLTPGPRTTATVRGGRRYGRDNWSGSLEYRISGRTAVFARYSEEITTTQQILFDELIENPDGEVIDPGGFSLVDRSFKRNRASGGVRGSRGRNSFSLTGFWEERKSETGARPDETIYGGSGRLSRTFSRYLSGTAYGLYQNTEYEGDILREDDFYSASAGLNYRLSPSVTSGLTYIFTYRDSTIDDRTIKENAVRLSIRATF